MQRLSVNDHGIADEPRCAHQRPVLLRPIAIRCAVQTACSRALWSVMSAVAWAYGTVRFPATPPGLYLAAALKNQEKRVII